MKKIGLILGFLLLMWTGYSQNVGISDDNAFTPSYLLHIKPLNTYANALFSVQFNTNTYMHITNGGQTIVGNSTPVMSDDLLTGYASTLSLAWGVAGYHVGTNGGGGFFQINGPTNGYNAGESWTDGVGAGFMVGTTNTTNNMIAIWTQTSAANSRYGLYSPNRCLSLAWLIISDARLKQNIKTIKTNVTADLMKIVPVTYSFVESLSKIKTLEYGFTTQNVETVFPELVVKNGVYDPSVKVTPKGKLDPKNFKYDGLNYSGFIPILVKVIQEQQILIIELQKRVDNLEKLKK